MSFLVPIHGVVAVAVAVFILLLPELEGLSNEVQVAALVGIDLANMLCAGR